MNPIKIHINIAIMICKMCGYKNSRFNKMQEVIKMLQMNNYYLHFLCLPNSSDML